MLMAHTTTQQRVCAESLLLPYSVGNSTQESACRVAEVSCPLLQHMGPSWVLAWALVGMAMAAALGDQLWCSAPMGAAASSPFS